MDPQTLTDLPRLGSPQSDPPRRGLIARLTHKFSRKSHDPPFYALDAELPLLLAMASGLQHSLAMLAGQITPPIIFASALSLDSATSSYMISASLIGCGILSLVQISRGPSVAWLFGNWLISGTASFFSFEVSRCLNHHSTVVGTSFSTLSTADAIVDAMYRDGICSSTTAPDGTITCDACPDAYGKLLGTSLICSFLEMFLAFVPSRVPKRIFPSMITGLLIGAALVGDSGALNWGGGANGCQNFPTSGIFEVCPTIFAPLPWGSPEFIGLGFLSFVSIILTELIIVGLAVGCIVAGAAGYIDGSSIENHRRLPFSGTVHTFKIGVYAPAILPISLAMEAIGDITASAEVSRVDVRGLEFDSRVQGGVLSDAMGGFFSALFTVTPLSIFAQNNGVIAITRCANRAAGRWCCIFLILFGVLGKISGALLAIPNSVLGGVTTFLFASVAYSLYALRVSGLRVLSFNCYSRRDRFVLASALSFGLADLLVPQPFTHLFDGVKHPNSALQGFFNSITIILSTPWIMAMGDT
ncbi:Xanthine/uracil/vitamin C permease [Mycena filopes]|nr:Xanthine/uracil/vitamin C permease [Mycena filopes]